MTTGTAKLPIAVAGAGLIGMRHVLLAQDHPAVELTAVIEPNAALRDELTARGLPAIAELSDLPAHTRAVIVATPTPDHRASTLAALAAGCAVLVEKPMAGTLGDANMMIIAAERAGLPLRVGHHRRCHPFVQAGPPLLEAIGPLVGVQGIWSLRKNDAYFDVPWRNKPGSGPLMTNISHDIDHIRLFAGEISEITALTSNALRGGTLEDTAALAFRFENGALGTFLLSDAGASPWAFEAASGENPYIATSGQDNLRLIGARGALSLPSLTLWTNTQGGETQWGTALTAQPGPDLPKVDPLRLQLEHFAQVVDGKDSGVLATGTDARATLAATLACARAAELCMPVGPDTVPLDYPGFSRSAIPT